MDNSLLPYDSDAEYEILSCCLNVEDGQEDIFYHLNEEDFYTIGSQRVFKAISILKKDNDLNHCTLRNYLNGDVEGLAVFSNVIHNYYGTEKAKFFLNKLKQKSFERKLIILGDKIQELGKWNQKFRDKESFKDTTSLQAEIEKLYRSLDAGVIEDDCINSNQLFLELKYKIPETPVLMSGITSGFTCLDNIIGGFQKSNLIYIAGRPGMGKTAFVVNSLLRAADEMKNSDGQFIFYSMEQSIEDIAFRCLSILDDTITPLNAKRGRITTEQRENINKLLDKMRKLPVLWFDVNDRDYNKFEAKIRRQMRNNKILGVYVDHMGQFCLPGYEKSKYNEVSEIATRLQVFCKEINAPLICLSQLSRDIEKRNCKIPMLSDLRESGRIEETAWIVMFLYRDEYYNPDSENKGEIKVIVAKNRDGCTGEVNLRFNKKSLRVYEERKENELYDTPY